MTRPVIAVGAVVLAEGHLLLVTRARPPATGLWTIPGGKVEAGELLTDAVEREVAEETGLSVSCGPFIGWVERIGEGFHFVILDFLATVLPDSSRQRSLPALVAGDDAGEARWVAVDRLTEHETVAGLVEFLVDHGVISP